MLKGKFSRQIGNSEHVYFRAIDTDEKELEQVRKLRADGSRNPNGELEKEETISLYNPVIQNSGAQQTRQIGRAMLVNSISYEYVKKNLWQLSIRRLHGQIKIMRM